MINLHDNHLDDLVHNLRTRASIRRNATSRKSVQEGKPDRISDLLEEAARVISAQQKWRETILERDRKTWRNFPGSNYD